MEKDYKKIEPPVHLLQKIIARIEKEERLLVLKRRIFIFLTGLSGLTVALVYAFRLAQTTIINSGFSEYFSLIFSDPGVIAQYWQNFFLTLLESFPVAETALFLFVVLMLLQVFKFLSRDFKNIRNLQTA
jgi:hypothetical protein